YYCTIGCVIIKPIKDKGFINMEIVTKKIIYEIIYCTIGCVIIKPIKDKGFINMEIVTKKIIYEIIYCIEYCLYRIHEMTFMYTKYML
ncbi:hypothetical protein DW997_07900, partial [Veillonella sp. AM51-8BH]|uniref:hypothetical protein n=1 Tax=Veillonella sp. AM51-8BH TaxID=2292378 RepID=UPI000FF1B399